MSVRAQLSDGRVLEFPDGTDPAVVQATVKKVIGKSDSPKTAPTVPKSMAAKVGEATNWVANNFNQGVLDLLGIPADAVQNVQNLLRAGYGVTRSKAEDQPDPVHGMPGTSEWLKKLFEKGGLVDTTPAATSGGRMAEAAIQSVPAALTGKVPESLPELATNLAGVVLPAEVAQGAAESGASPATQQAAALLGQKGGSVTARTPQAVRRALVGTTNITQNLRDQRQAGVTQPSAGAIADSRVLKSTEAALGHLPGSDLVMDKAARSRGTDVGNKVAGIAKSLAPHGASAEQAGKALQSGIEGEVERFKGVQQKLYGRVASLIPKDTPVILNNFEHALHDFTRKVPGAKQTTGSLVNPKIQQLFDDVQADLKGNLARTMPYEAADLIRKRIGQALDDNALVSDFPKAQLKKLYGSITTDIESALGKDTPARKAWDRARRYTQTGRDRIDNVLQPLADKGTPEKALKAAMDGTKEGASAFRRIMGSLTPKQADVVRANVVEGMGKATAGAQGAAGNTFSMDTFLTNWNRLSPEARKTLFADPKVQTDMATIARVAEQYKKSGSPLYNPSGTTRAAGYGALGLQFVRSVLTGNLGEAATVASIPVANYSLARAMSSPKFIKWLADGTKMPKDRSVQHIAQLEIIADRASDPEQKEAIHQIHDLAQGVQ